MGFKAELSVNRRLIDVLETKSVHQSHRAGGIPGRKPIIRLYLTAMLLLSMMFTVYVWQSTKMVEIKLRIKNSEKQIETYKTDNAILHAEISKLQAISRIEKVAKEDLGMIVPKNICYIPMPVSKNE